VTDAVLEGRAADTTPSGDIRENWHSRVRCRFEKVSEVSRSESGEGHGQRPLKRRRNEAKRRRLIWVGAHQSRVRADTWVATPIGRQDQHLAKELPRAKRRAELGRKTALTLGPPRVRRPRRDTDLLARPDAYPLTAETNQQQPGIDDESLLLAAVDVQRPTVCAFRGFDPLPLHLVSRRGVVLYPHPATLHDLRLAHEATNLPRPGVATHLRAL